MRTTTRASGNSDYRALSRISASPGRRAADPATRTTAASAGRGATSKIRNSDIPRIADARCEHPGIVRATARSAVAPAAGRAASARRAKSEPPATPRSVRAKYGPPRGAAGLSPGRRNSTVAPARWRALSRAAGRQAAARTALVVIAVAAARAARPAAGAEAVGLPRARRPPDAPRQAVLNRGCPTLRGAKPDLPSLCPAA